MLKSITILALMATALITGCGGPTAQPESPLNITPEPRTMLLPDLFSARSGTVTAASGERESASVEEALEMGLSEAGASPAHLAFIGTMKERLYAMRLERRGKNHATT